MEMPKFLLSKKFLTESVIVILGFAVVFLLVYRPFSATLWFGFSSSRRIIYTLEFFALAILIVGSSKYVMYRFQLKHVLTISRFILWIAAEYIFLAMLYISFSSSVIGREMSFSAPLILRTALCIGLILIIPYAYMSLYAAYRAQKEEVDMLRQSLKAAEGGKMVNLYDYRGELSLSIKEQSIYYIEAQDNYVQVWYDNEGSLQHYMMRCTTQKLQSMIEGTALIRCHRSAIINLMHMQNFMRGHNCATVILDHPDIKEISVSKSYYRSVLERIREMNPSTDLFIRRT